MKRALHTPRGGQGRLQRFSSCVAESMLLAESSLEFDVFRDIELDPLVTGLVEQPLRIRYRMEGAWRRYTPDLLALRSDKFELIEVKPEEMAAKLEPKWRAIGSALSNLGFDFTVLTERHVRRHPRKRNVDQIYRCRHVPFTADTATALSGFLGDVGPQRAGHVAARFDLHLNQLWAMVRRLHLTVDLDAALLDASTKISVRRTNQIGSCNGGLKP